jgi:hypothetical protein
MATITVHDLDTYNEYEYTGPLSHAEAVRNAYALYVCKDTNTWEYEKRYPLANVVVRTHGNKRVYSLGGMSAVETIEASHA